VDTSEIILLKEEEPLVSYPLEREIISEDLSETLPPDGELIVDEWIYEQLSLAMPLRILCSNDCKAPVIKAQNHGTIKDDRWSSLASLLDR
jgi:uncharacterized protein